MNKNTRQLRKAISAASKKGESSVAVQKPVYNYHSRSGSKESFFTSVSHPTAIRGKDGVVSSSRKRNMAMKVLLNLDERGKRASLTVHEPLDKSAYVGFKGHGYLRKDERNNNQYRQWKKDTSRPVAA